MTKPAADPKPPVKAKAKPHVFTKDFDYNSKVDPKTGAVLEQVAYRAGESYDTVPAKHLSAAREAGALPAGDAEG